MDPGGDAGAGRRCLGSVRRDEIAGRHDGVASSTITERHGDATVLTNQRAGLFDRTPLGIAVALCWIAVLGCGVFAGCEDCDGAPSLSLLV